MIENSHPKTSKNLRKAAILLLSLGKEEVAKALSKLDEKQIEELMLEISKIESISPEERASSLIEFRNTIKKREDEKLKGGFEKAKEILGYSFGDEKAEAIYIKLSKKNLSEDFEFLNEIEPNVLSQLLYSEADQTIAVTLSFLNPKISASVLKNFPSERQVKIAFKLANTSKTHPDAIKDIAKILKERFEQRNKIEYSEAGGVQVLANILNHLDQDSEKGIMKNLEEKSPELAKQVQDKLYSFEDLLKLSTSEMRLLISLIQSDEIISKSLRGSHDRIKIQFFNNLSNNRVTDILELMNDQEKISLREINEARGKIIDLIRRLEEEGKIYLNKELDEYI